MDRAFGLTLGHIMVSVWMFIPYQDYNFCPFYLGVVIILEVHMGWGNNSNFKAFQVILLFHVIL